MQIIDTHCHIHDDDFPIDRFAALEDAHAEGVSPLIVIGTSVEYSRQAVEFAMKAGREVYATVAIHPHDAARSGETVSKIRSIAKDALGISPGTIVGIGECGLDYWYQNSDRISQQSVFRQHLELAHELSLPLSLHIRGEKEDQTSAVEDALQIIADVESELSWKSEAVVHSFSGTKKQLERFLEKGYFIGVNGIATFSKDSEQIEMFRSIPLKRLVLETDAPYLTPKPYRGKVNEPKMIVHTLRFMADLHRVSEEDLAKMTTENAKRLFKLT